MKIGAHISTRTPFSDSIKRAEEIGCECAQIFVNPPTRWNPVPISENEIDKFVAQNKKAKIEPIIIHGIYLINLASSNPFFYQASINSLVDEMKKAKALGALGVNFHVGSTKGSHIKEVMHKVESAVKIILDASPKGPFLIIENSAGAGNIIGDTIEEISEIIKAVQSDRIRVLIDTAHAFESGYNLKDEKGLEKFLEKFEKEISLKKLVGFHFNDSKTTLNSKRDRHADIGTGEIGRDTFKIILNHPKLKDKFAILETPEDQMNWREQIILLKSLRSSK